jgi:hypothetical protein
MTAVEWLLEELKIRYDIYNSDELFEQAKEMENRQSKNYAEFAIHCDREKMKILNFNDFMKL